MNTPLVLTADSSPFAWVYRFDASGVGEPLPDPAPSAMSGPDGYIWVHLNLADARSRGWISSVETLHPEVRSMLIGTDEHIRLHGQGSTIWGVLSDFGREPGEISRSLSQIRIAVGDHYVISARRHPIQAAEATRIMVANGATFETPMDLFEALVGNIVSALEKTGEKTITAINSIEDRVLDGKIKSEFRELGPLRREAVSLHRQATGLQRVLARFDDPSRVNGEAHMCLRRLLQGVESIHHELHVVLDLRTSSLSVFLLIVEAPTCRPRGPKYPASRIWSSKLIF